MILDVKVMELGGEMAQEGKQFCNADVYYHSVDKKHANAKLIGFSWNIHLLMLKELGVIVWLWSKYGGAGQRDFFAI